MDLKNFQAALDGALGVVQQLAPIAKALGGPAVSNLADMAASAASVGRNVLTRAEETEGMLTEADATKAKATIDKLAGINDGLAAEIAES